MIILHVTAWYPSTTSPFAAIWIKKHIDSLKHSHNIIIHLEQVPSWKVGVNFSVIENIQRYQVLFPSSSWFLKEIFTSIVLFYLLVIRRKALKVDLINFHIAYPNLTYWHKLKRWVRKPILITEHWSAYHFNFGVKKQLPRVQRIFKQGIPIIAVSNALKTDLEQFSGAEIESYIVPNIVDQEVFYPDPAVSRGKNFFMVSQWNYPKNPIIAMEAFKEFHKINPDYKLLIGGYGKQWPQIQDWLREKKLTDCIELVGKLSTVEIAHYMKSCTGFIHPSEYETFSVVCAEAVSCHTPVIAPNIGGIPEVVGSGGLLLNKFNVRNLTQAMQELLSREFAFTGINRFSEEKVSLLYSKVIESTVKDFKTA